MSQRLSIPAGWGENPASSRVRSLPHAGISRFSQSWYLRAGVAGAARLPQRAFPGEIRVRAAFRTDLQLPVMTEQPSLPPMSDDWQTARSRDKPSSGNSLATNAVLLPAGL